MEIIKKLEKEKAIKKIKSFIRRDNITTSELNYIALFVDRFYNNKIYTAEDIKELLLDLIFTDVD